MAGSAGNHAQAVAYRRPAPRRALRDLRPRGRLDLQGRGHPLLRRDGAPDRRDGRRRGGRGPHPGRRGRVWPSSTPSTTWPSSPARPRWGSSWWRTSRISAASIVPVGGGGLASGVAIAVKQADRHDRVVGVQVDGCAPVHQPARGRQGAITTLADGIAVKAARPAHATSGRGVGGRHRDGQRGRGGRRHDVPDGTGQALRRGRWCGRRRGTDGGTGGTGAVPA